MNVRETRHHPTSALVAFKRACRARLARAGAILKEAGGRWWDDDAPRRGASLAFYALFSIFPLLLVVAAILGFVLGDAASTRESLVASVARVLSPESRTLLDDTLASMQSHQTARGVGAAVGVVTLLFGASGVFSELDTSLNAIWRVEPARSAALGTAVLRALADKAVSLLAVAGATGVLLTSLLVSSALAAVSGAGEHVVADPVFWRGLEDIVSFALASLLFAFVFRVFPRTEVLWRDVRAGALFTALLFIPLKRALAFYLGHIGSYAAYGAVGGVLGLLMWIYVVSLVVFFGAEVTRVYAEREGSLAGRARADSPREKGGLS